jgi:hypothetical protein
MPGSRVLAWLLMKLDMQNPLADDQGGTFPGAVSL